MFLGGSDRFFFFEHNNFPLTSIIPPRERSFKIFMVVKMPKNVDTTMFLYDFEIFRNMLICSIIYYITIKNDDFYDKDHRFF